MLSMLLTCVAKPKHHATSFISTGCMSVYRTRDYSCCYVNVPSVHMILSTAVKADSKLIKPGVRLLIAWKDEQTALGKEQLSLFEALWKSWFKGQH